ncbi:hypothetical protein SAMN04488078_11173 [Antarctobacter heliothermus]|uniref:Uncharacterized protein n=1 Tax=Antarctobacter heliothermus TaxID=74033 RepID=A0A239M3D0_9RHOB|nr:hypothetical protein SAMN04488078_11173 [Antarctobacter heliothermus]
MSGSGKQYCSKDSLDGIRMAIRVAELARAGLTPDWMPGALPRCVPEETRQNQHGVQAVTEVVGTERILSRGRWRTVEVLACRVTWRPHPEQIASARRGYEGWRGAHASGCRNDRGDAAGAAMETVGHSRKAGSGHSPQLREARVREEQATIHRPFDHCVDAALCIKVSNAQKASFAKFGPSSDSGLSCSARRKPGESPKTDRCCILHERRLSSEQYSGVSIIFSGRC